MKIQNTFVAPTSSDLTRDHTALRVARLRRLHGMSETRARLIAALAYGGGHAR